MKVAWQTLGIFSILMLPKSFLTDNIFIPLVFVISNTDPLFTHEACVTQLAPLSGAAGLQVCQRLVPSLEPPPGVQGRHSVPELHLCEAPPLVWVQHSLPKGTPAILFKHYVGNFEDNVP